MALINYLISLRHIALLYREECNAPVNLFCPQTVDTYFHALGEFSEFVSRFSELSEMPEQA